MTTNITTTTDTTTVTVTENVVEIELNNVGVQGTPGLSGVVAVTSPITNSGSAGSAIVGINQALLSITKSQVSDFTSGTVTSASTAQQSGTAVYSVNSGTAVYATTSGTAVSISGSITKSQVSDFTSGTVTSASTAQQSGTAVYATTSGTADFATNASTAVNVSGSAITRSQISDFTSGTVASAGTAQQAGTATYATTSGTAVFATTSGTSVSISGSITRSQVSDYAAGTVANISGTVTQSQVTNLVSDLALKAPLASPTFSGTVTLPFTSQGLLVSGSTGAVTKTDAAPDIGYFPSTGTGAAGYVWNQLSNYARRDQVNAFTVGGHTIATGSDATKGLSINGNSATQSANLFEATQTSSVVVNGSGNLVTTGPIQVTGIRNPSIQTVISLNTSGINVFSNNNTAGNVGLAVRGAASQSANLQEWQNSGGTALAKVDSSGNLFANQIRTLNSYVNITESNSGGSIRLLKATAAAAPLSNEVRITVLAGTLVNTLKLVAVGPGGVAVTILDNLA